MSRLGIGIIVDIRIFRSCGNSRDSNRSRVRPQGLISVANPSIRARTTH